MADVKKGNHAKHDENRERTRQLVVEDVFLYITCTKDPLMYTYEVGNSSDNAVKLSLDFARSVNFTAVDESGSPMAAANLAAIICPYSRRVMGSMIQGDIRIASRLAVDCYYELVEVDEEEMKLAAEEHEAKVSEQLVQEDSGLYIDKTFLPCSESLYVVNKCAGEEQSEEPEEVTSKKPIVWTRPEDFMIGKYDVFLGGIDPGDICQGSLGDCWFLCCLACLGEFPALVENLFANGSRKLNGNGKYEIGMYNYGMLEKIVVDDFFPCRPNGGPVYARGHDNELWVLLLEKAYAKLCGSYAALKSGWAYEAMIDLLGAPFTSIRFEDEDAKEMIANGSLWELILSYDEMGHIQTASTPGEDKLTEGGNRKAKDDSTGLVSGHAYALLRAREISTGAKLVEIRNPWGQGGMEWNGDWSDKSPLWTDEIINEIDARLKDDDGAFWMSFEDFLTHFFSINVCMVGQPLHSTDGRRKPWFESRERFDYSMIIEDGANEVCANSFLLTLHEDAETMYVSVHQEDIRHVNTTSYIDFGVVVLKVCPDSASGYKLISSTGNSCDRQNQSVALKLEAGEYLILPTSTGCKLMNKPGQTHKAGVVVHSSAPHTMVKKPYNEHAYDNAVELPIMMFGTAKEIMPGKITMYTRKAGFNGVSYVIKNTHTETLKFTMDCSKGKNIVSHRGTLSYTAVLEPGQEEVVHHIMPDDTMKGWQSGHSAELEWC